MSKAVYRIAVLEVCGDAEACREPPETVIDYLRYPTPTHLLILQYVLPRGSFLYFAFPAMLCDQGTWLNNSNTRMILVRRKSHRGPFRTEPTVSAYRDYLPYLLDICSLDLWRVSNNERRAQ